MEFEFDDSKSRSNKLKHGIDFITARKLWDDAERVVIPARTLDEPRFVLIAVINNETWSAIYTVKNEIIRIISVRRSRQNEKEIYQR